MENGSGTVYKRRHLIRLNSCCLYVWTNLPKTTGLPETKFLIPCSSGKTARYDYEYKTLWSVQIIFLALWTVGRKRM